MKQHFSILGTGRHVPGDAVSAAEIEARAGLPTGWIAQNTAVKTRYECQPPETLGSMAKQAILNCLEDADADWSHIDLLMDCSTSRHQPIPCNAATLLSMFGTEAANATGFDVYGTCLGFLLGLNVANSLLAQQQCRQILLVASEATLKAANWREPEGATLLGDGAAAMLIERAEPNSDFHFKQETFSEHIDECAVRGGDHNLTVFEMTDENQDFFRFQMAGPKLFQTALKKLPPMVEQLTSQPTVDTENLLVIPHQASPKAVELIRRRLGFTKDLFLNIAEDYGNMAAASIPFTLDYVRRNQSPERGRQVMLLGTSAGYSQAGLIFEL